MYVVIHVEDMTEKEIKSLLSRKNIVNESEWINNYTMKSVYVKRSDVDEELVEKMEYFWVGYNRDEIDIMLEYKVKVEHEKIILDILSYVTHVDGFIGVVKFSVDRMDTAVETLINIWMNELE